MSMDSKEEPKISHRARVRAFKKAAVNRRVFTRGLFTGSEVVSDHRFGRVGAFEKKVAKRHAASKAAGRTRKATR